MGADRPIVYKVIKGAIGDIVHQNGPFVKLLSENLQICLNFKLYLNRNSQVNGWIISMNVYNAAYNYKTT